jgi:hypothetical protein
MYASHFHFGGYPSAGLTWLFSLEFMQRDNARFHKKRAFPGWRRLTASLARASSAATNLCGSKRNCLDLSFAHRIFLLPGDSRCAKNGNSARILWSRLTYCKQTSYRPRSRYSALGFCCQSGIIFLLSIRSTSYKSARPPGHTELALCSAPGARALEAWEKRTCEFSSQGNSLRHVSQCGTGWSRNSTSPGFSPGSKSKASANLIFFGRTGRYSHPSALAPILLQASNRFFRPFAMRSPRSANSARRVPQILFGLFVR